MIWLHIVSVQASSKGKTTQKCIFNRPALIQFHWFRGEYLMDQLNLDVNKWTSCRVLELCPDGAARCPLTHCLWEDWRRRSEYVDPLKMLGRNTRIQQYSVTAGCAFCSSSICSSLRKRASTKNGRQERVKWGAERVQEKRRNDRGASKERRGVMWLTSTRGNRSEDASGSRLQALINNSIIIKEK